MQYFSSFTSVTIYIYRTLLVFLLFSSVFFFSSCGTIKPSYYFQTLSKDTTLQGFVTASFESKIQKKDLLRILVSSLSPEMNNEFNGGGTSDMGVDGSKSATPGYLVNEQGEITVHHLGKIPVAGLTVKELQEKLQRDLLPYMKEPIVSVQFLNHKITMLGAVTKPQIINMPDEQMSVIDAIVSSGDLAENANRKNIMIIRETGTEKQIKHINLEDHSIFSSPWYYLQPNDIVYIMQDEDNKLKEEKRRKVQTTVSLGVSIVSLIVIILNSLLK